MTDSPTPPAIPANPLRSRTFLGLLVAQFLAAFNDQAIHAAAMFYAINTQALSERDAISLMPVLFYLPWAIFCTIAGYLADKYSKRTSLVWWKVAEVAITGVALGGFYLGTHGHENVGPWVVLGCVFLMGTHSAFFVPAKYGVMPEILPPELLSKGNGILESLSFLAVILGTVSGGVLSYRYHGQEEVIGLILLMLACVGAIASFFIRTVPAANPDRKFPPYLYGPLLQNVRTLFADNRLRLAVVGIAFFTFVVAFMRAAVYMLGESHSPRWDELKTSAVVGTVALGIGLGSPLAGWLSGRRVELRLVPFGAVGMILSCAAAGLFIDDLGLLVVSIVAVGFFTGFYIVPLFTLLQHRAPKTSKGDMIATSNCVNISGAIAASLLFFLVVFVAQKTGLVPKVTDSQRTERTGQLTRLDYYRGRPVYLEIATEDQGVYTLGKMPDGSKPPTLARVAKHLFDSEGETDEIDLAKEVKPGKAGADAPWVRVSEYKIEGTKVWHYEVVPVDHAPKPSYDQRRLPRFLFLGAAGMTFGIIALILRPLLRVWRAGV